MPKQEAKTKTQLPDQLIAAAPGSLRWTQAAIAWGGALFAAITFVFLGNAINQLQAGEPIQFWLTGCLVLSALLSAGFAAFGAWFTSVSVARTEAKLRQSLLTEHFNSSTGTDTDNSGELLAVATDSVAKAAEYRGGFLGPIVGAFTTPVIVLAVMALTVSPSIAGFLTLLLIVVPLLVGAFQRLVRPIGAAFGAKQRALTAMFFESIQALETLVYARAARRRALQLAREGEEYRRTLMRVLAGNQLLIFVVDAAFSLAIIVAATGLSAAAVASGSLSLGGAVTILLMTVLIVGPVDMIGMFFYIGIGGRAAQKRIAQKFAKPRAATATHTNEAPTQASAGIKFAGVSGGWQREHPVLKDLSFEVHPGERVGLVGPSGAGKSTVAALIQGWLLPEAGTVEVAGFDTRTVEPEVLRRKIAVVEQRTFLFAASIADNLRIAAPDATEAELWHALDIAGLSDDVRGMPDGLQTLVGEHGARISGGQAQRLAIARAALHGGDVLLLDEATSQIGLAAEASVLAALERLSEGRTVLMIAHRPSALNHVDRVIELGRGGSLEH